MASINVGSADFGALFVAAHLAKRAGEHELAAALDKLARKTNAALSTAPKLPGVHVPNQRWTDVPSVFDVPTPDDGEFAPDTEPLTPERLEPVHAAVARVVPEGGCVDEEF